MSCHLVRHFHVLTFHALQIGPSISCAAFSCPSFSAPPLVYELGATWPWTTLNSAPNVFKLRPARTNLTSAQCYSLIRDVCSVFKNTGQLQVCSSDHRWPSVSILICDCKHTALYCTVSEIQLQLVGRKSRICHTPSGTCVHSPIRGDLAEFRNAISLTENYDEGLGLASDGKRNSTMR